MRAEQVSITIGLIALAILLGAIAIMLVAQQTTPAWGWGTSSGTPRGVDLPIEPFILRLDDGSLRMWVRFGNETKVRESTDDFGSGWRLEGRENE